MKPFARQHVDAPSFSDTIARSFAEASAGVARRATQAGAPSGASAASEHRERVYLDMRANVAARVSRSMQSAGSDMPDVPHPRMVGVLLPEISIAPVSELSAFVTAEHTAGRHGVLDGEGMPVVWPWESRHSAQPSKRPQDTLDAMINQGIDAATVDGSRGRFSTGVRAWFSFNEDERSSPHRPMDPNMPLMLKLHEEWRIMRFVCALVQERGVAVTTASQYFSQVQGWGWTTACERVGASWKACSPWFYVVTYNMKVSM